PLDKIRTVTRLRRQTLLALWHHCRGQSCILPSQLVVQSDETPEPEQTDALRGAVLLEQRTHSVSGQTGAHSRVLRPGQTRPIHPDRVRRFPRGRETRRSPPFVGRSRTSPNQRDFAIPYAPAHAQNERRKIQVRLTRDGLPDACRPPC